ncbi:hypothetical protein R69927_03841 [Paraburkholderia domus]|jgi:P pilus assembly protein, pilin FimA|uniref:Fimbrial-type adhesion domain-containing protein n=1 Tax=Paraburkholderia domus TaxID=2793075 RepID=A0A9N8MUX3_9BURK|nr:fimbrial protein [Paraburkholderia domus]MBK5050874.1 fimbrial protein [Burkholderia sp. R-70006]MBK5061013.1 fimbrial protein [Burkholderia sp. R-70199]MBK5088256.1 fimbrial protein [Burkholderia sp. R-69927]MBK5121259.1 fimbrial protein [Burkholderia sp. R-69980]MBK5166208.1 fimbrial protein [Burkholderia sp. R-70211]MBK5179440.1 fimbrial protein [Burkholderia sp. R-69749]MCI0146378.1 fimbrial protein [Paraburkholderia sediminicola]
MNPILSSDIEFRVPSNCRTAGKVNLVSQGMDIMNFASGMASKLSRFVVAACRGKGLLGLLVACVALLLGGPEAYADCSRTKTLPDVVAQFPSTINVPRDAVNGAVLATVTVPVAGATAGMNYATCSGGGSLYWAITAGPIVANRIGSTSVSGVGYTSSLSGGGFGSSIGMDSQLDAATVPGGPSSPTFTSQLYVTVNLVKTGPVTPGALSLNPSGPGVGGRVGTLFIGGSGQGLFNVVVSSGASSVTAAACTVTTPSTNVVLAQANTRALTGIGSTAVETPFSIGLNCAVPGSRIFITLTDSADPTNVSNQLSLKSSSTANGVKLQVLNAGTPVNFGPDSSMAGNTNQWQVGTATAGTIIIPLTVRYIQTAASVRPGTVSAVATFTMSYQ